MTHPFTRRLLTSVILAGATLLAGPVFANELQSLQNMERERAVLISAFRDHALETGVRHSRVHAQQSKLIDLERLVLRDDRLLGNRDRLVRLTFSDYDLSFLVHASTESSQAPVEHWLGQLGFDTGSLLATEVGRR